MCQCLNGGGAWQGKLSPDVEAISRTSDQDPSTFTSHPSNAALNPVKAGKARKPCKPRDTCAGNLDDEMALRLEYLLTVASIFWQQNTFLKQLVRGVQVTTWFGQQYPRVFRRENLLERESWAVKLYLCSAVHLSHSRTDCTQKKKVHVYENKLKLIHKFSSTQQ